MQRRIVMIVVAGLLTLYIGERVFAETQRFIIGGIGLVALIAGIVLAAVRFAGASGQRRVATRRALVSYGVCVLAVVVYALQTEKLGLVDDGKLRTVMMIGWPVLMVFGLAQAIAIERVLRSVEHAAELELWRVGLATRSAHIILFSLIAFAGVNYAAAAWNKKIDLSYFKTSRVGTSNKAMIADISKPLTVYLFFPPGNEVLENARSYAEELVAGSELATVEVVDQALNPELSRKLKVQNNGYLVLSLEDKHESLRLGLNISGASSKLRKLDQDVQTRLTKVLRPARVAYITTGHLERDYSPVSGDDRLALSDFRQVLQTLSFKTKRLGLGEGLGSEIPDDATVVIVPGPIEPFLPTEITALGRYMDRGGRLMIFVDPDQGTTADALLAPLGVQVTQALVASDNPKHQWRIEGKRESPYQIATNKASFHPSANTLSRSGGRLSVLVLGAGQVTKLDQVPAKTKVTFTVRSMQKNWVDKNGNRRFDEGSEKRSSIDLVAAIERSGKGDHPEMRALVFTDADMIGNIVVRNQGNYALIMDGMRWLAGDEKSAGTVESEKDVRITHRKDEDRIWFYGSSVLVPLSVLMIGVMISRRSGKRGAV